MEKECWVTWALQQCWHHRGESTTQDFAGLPICNGSVEGLCMRRSAAHRYDAANENSAFLASAVTQTHWQERRQRFTTALDGVDQLVLQGAHGDIRPLRHIEDLVRQTALRATRLLHLQNRRCPFTMIA